jgi:NADPH2:quinone reductase
VKNYAVIGLHWGMYNLHEPSAVQATQADLYRLWSEGKIAPLVSAAMPMSEAPAAMTRVASRGSTGKVVLIP